VGLHLQTAHKLAEQLLRLAQLVQDSALLVVAHYTLGSTFFAMGKLTSARTHLEQGIAFYDPAAHRALAFRYGSFDPGVACLTYEAWALWHLGYPDQALTSIQQALTLARELTHPFTLALVSSFAAFLHQYRREWHAAQEQAEVAIALSNEHGFANWLTLGTILRGWALAEQGQGDEGIAQMHQGLAHHNALGARTTQSYTLALLGEVYRKAGRLEEGLTQLAEALALADRTEERVYDPELYRLKGQLTLQSQVPSPKSQVDNPQSAIRNPQLEEAEACFLKAIEIARGQQAKSWELRAVTSLARLWLRQGKKAEARQRLAEVYGWFTEGFATADLQEAGALLAEVQEEQKEQEVQ
jgi:predicted ATPase